MELPFLDRQEEAGRLRRFYQRETSALAVLYGRRRCGKSRLLLETLPAQGCVYYVADEREPALQRASLAREMARILVGFDQVLYPDWEALFSRWWQAAPRGSVLVLDEFPALAAMDSAVPSVLQRNLDRRHGQAHLVLCGSSQRMMQGLVLDRSAPLFGRAVEILKISPLPAGWIGGALGLDEHPVAAVEAFAVWGGVPRYWELAAPFSDQTEAIRNLVLDPLGVLHREPLALLYDDLRDTAQSASILQLIGQGCHRLSEIASRLEKPATSLHRPLQRLLELELVRRDRPFGALAKDSKRSLYRLGDPFLRFWFRYVEPNRSRLESRAVDSVARAVQASFNQHVAGIWEDLARQSVPGLNLYDREWNPAAPWWGPGSDGKPMELDVVADSVDGKALLAGSVKWEESTDRSRVMSELIERSSRLPLAASRQVFHALWLKRAQGKGPETCVHPGKLLPFLR